MSHTNFIFTDAIKDVIGNDPVLDQFDIDYEASFYNTMQDDYITGSMLEFSKNSVGTTKFSTGRGRGRLLSKYYAESKPQLSSVYGSSDVTNIPRLSFREVPWSEKVSSTAYRISQAHDSTEMFYDSCLPDISVCLQANGSSPWTPKTSAEDWFSPYRNVETQDIGYLYFNSVKNDRTLIGLSTDPLVDNDWTWSYPFEPRYQDAPRIAATSNLFSKMKSYFSSDWNGTLFPEITPRLNPSAIKKFLPLLPGDKNSGYYAAGGRNSFRQYVTGYVTGATGNVISTYVAYPNLSGSQYDNVFGYSYLIPSDVDLGKLSDRSYLSGYPVTVAAPAQVTGTMSLNDTVKFLFGFGDMNNMTWSSRLFLSESIRTPLYTEDFDYVNGTAAHDIPTFSGGVLTLDWSQSNQSQSWQVVKNQLPDSPATNQNFFDSGKLLADPADYYYEISGSSTPTVGIYWKSSPSITTTVTSTILLSDTDQTRGSMTATANISRAIVDITSSFPWTLSFYRGIVASDNDKLITYFSAIPGDKNTSVILDEVTGSLAKTLTVLKQYSYDQPPLSDGEYRLVFDFVRSPDAKAGISRSAIKDLTITQYSLDAFPPDENSQKLGGNNYPTFRAYKCDTRNNPIAGAGNPPLLGTDAEVSGSGQQYSGEIFGVSPVIRGWKYGLYNGFPTHSKVIFRRNRFGQFRDMLEQRSYTKFIKDNTSPADNEAITPVGFDKDNGSTWEKAIIDSAVAGTSVVTVSFVSQSYSVDDRGIGRIFNQQVEPSKTLSRNLSPEVTSSLPFFDFD